MKLFGNLLCCNEGMKFNMLNIDLHVQVCVLSRYSVSIHLQAIGILPIFP